jgi:hypothetical protein
MAVIIYDPFTEFAYLFLLAAFEDIVTRNLIEIRKYGFGDSQSDEENKLEWSPIQFWTIVKQLTNKISVSL